MGATNTTTHYNLSQFVSTDKPAWLQDYNGDMAKIDAGIDAAKVAADTAQTTANSASGAATQNANDITALSTTVSGQGNNITALQLAVNTINSLIGNGTPTTTDQTIIGAINELHADITEIDTDFITVKFDSVTFVNGIATVPLPQAKTTSKFLVTRNYNNYGSAIFGAYCDTNGTLGLTACIASASPSGHNGAITNLVVLIDNR